VVGVDPAHPTTTAGLGGDNTMLRSEVHSDKELRKLEK